MASAQCSRVLSATARVRPISRARVPLAWRHNTYLAEPPRVKRDPPPTLSYKPPPISTNPPGERPSFISSLNQSLARALEADNIKDIVDLSHILVRRGVRPNIETYNTILRAFGKYHLLEDAWALFSDMETLGINPNVESYNYLIQSAENTPEALHPILQMMRDEYVIPDSTTFQNIIAHHANFLNIAMCLKTLHDMEVVGVVPNIQTAEMIVNTTILARQPKLALDYATLFEAQSPRRFEGRIWLNILSGSAEVFFAEGVEEGWHQAVVRGAIIPDEGLAIKILHTAARHGLPYIATDVLRIMKSAGIPFQEHHIAALLESFVVAGQVKDALFVLGIFSSESIDMTPETTHSLFKVISRNVDTVDEAYEHLEQLKRDDTKVSIAAFNAVLSAAVSLQDMQRAVGIYKAAEDLGVQADVESLNALLSGCILLAHRALGDKLVLEAREAGIRPNAGTYERLIVLCLTQPTYEDAFFYLEEMKAAGFKPTYQVYDSLIRRTAKALDQRWELAWEELQQAGYPFSDDLREYIGSIKKRR